MSRDILDELYSDKSTTAVITKILQLNNQSLVFPGIQLCKLTRDAFLPFLGIHFESQTRSIAASFF